MNKLITEVFGFLKWHWDQWSFSHRVYMLGAFCVGCGLPDAVKGTGPNIMMMIGLVFWFLIFLKWFVWDTVQASWARYREHRNELLTKIKMSDKELL
jgi:hypothetical protein